MKTKILAYMASLLLVLCLTVPAMAVTVSPVVQGKCLSYDKDKNLVTIEEYGTEFSPQNKYGNPTGKQSTYDLSNAMVGIPPAPGDILRIVYNEKGKERVAIKVMNVSKQDLMRK